MDIMAYAVGENSCREKKIELTYGEMNIWLRRNVIPISNLSQTFWLSLYDHFQKQSIVQLEIGGEGKECAAVASLSCCLASFL
jgi:hypothetical protein